MCVYETARAREYVCVSACGFMQHVPYASCVCMRECIVSVLVVVSEPTCMYVLLDVRVRACASVYVDLCACIPESVCACTYGY